MAIDVTRVPLEDILELRDLHRAEMACQIVHDSLHRRGFTHMYRLDVDSEVVGYGTVVGFGDEPKETVDEFFVKLRHRASARALFRAFLEASGATRIQTQSNDVLLSLMLFDFAVDIRRERLLFEDAFTSDLRLPNATFRRLRPDEAMRLMGGKQVDRAGDWILEVGHEIVGAGGVLFHYNPPYGDVYMEVAEGQRRKGYGSFLVQELKRICRDAGKIPAARCDADNEASRATLERAGMLPCGSIMTGTVGR